MFTQTPAFSSFSVQDLETAKDFYCDVLGLEIEEYEDEPYFNLELEDGINIMVYEKPNHKPASFTILNFLVDDIDEAVDELEDAEIEMQFYDNDDMKQDERGIWRSDDGMNMAWFTDPFGNVLSVLEDA